ncbi:MAG: 50S ribosomal protein L9 [Gammaproteobacteria bacterium]|jgi:large subunit ribosomal protein L9|nr:50S ribosomal protein L9 [Gammaproteobacteria bacterium]|tara:strand:+ start:8424 stop:9035 length:612 start_codon:yes stop_codon:yes gene_type:complete
MNVILLEKIGKLGEIGDTANVKSGYARNFLFPQGKAIPATKDNLVEFEQRKSELFAAHDEKVGAAQGRASKVDGTSLSIEVNASDEGKLFGSVGTRDIADALNAKLSSDITKREVLMPHGVIRELGDYELVLDLGQDVHASISVAVVGLQSAVDVTDDGSIIEEIDEAEAAEAEAAAEAEESAVAEESAETQAEEVDASKSAE